MTAKKQGIFANLYSNTSLLISYIVQDVKRGPMQLKIAVFSIFIIVAFMAFILNANNLTRTMFITLAERQVGDADFTITKSMNNQSQVTGTTTAGFNATVIRDSLPFIRINDTKTKLSGLDSITGVAPRWIIPGKLINPKNQTRTTTTFGIVGDSELEYSIGVGRRLDKLNIIKESECLIVKQTASMIGLEGSDVIFKIDFAKLIETMGGNAVLGTSGSIGNMVSNMIPNTLNITVVNTTSTSNNTANGATTLLGGLIGTDNIPAGFGEALSTGLAATIDAITGGNGGSIPIDLTPLKQAIPTTVDKILNLETNLTVKSILDSPQGKWPENLGNVAFFNYNFLLNRFRSNMNISLEELAANVTDNLTSQIVAGNQAAFGGLVDQIRNTILATIRNQTVIPILQFYDDLQLEDRALLMNAVVKDKQGTYSSFNSYQNKLVVLSNEIMDGLQDSVNYSMTSPMMAGFQVLGFISMFVGNFIYCIMILLAILSYILINSLMVFNIDEKTYEFGMLRALGLERKNLIYMLLMQGSAFAVAGWTFGVITSYVASAVVNYFYYLDARIKVAYTFTFLIWFVTVIFGFISPISTNFMAIRKSLGSNLKDSLDMYRRSINELTVVFVKLARLGISQTQFVLAIELTLYGFVFYYVAPLTFFYNRIDIFLLLLNLVLLGMVLGFAVIGNLLQPYFERLLVNIAALFMCKNRSLKVVISKNLQAHARRNIKTALMLSMSICFIIFSGSGMTTNAKGLVDRLISRQGGDIVGIRSGIDGYDEQGLLELFASYNKTKPGRITAQSFSFSDIVNIPFVSTCGLSPMSLYPKIRSFITGVEDSVMESVHQEYYIPNQYQDGHDYPKLSNGKKNGVAAIFETNGTATREKYDPNNIISLNQFRPQREVNVRDINAVMPTGLQDVTGIDVQTPSMLTIETDKGNIYARLNIVHTANMVPGFAYSSYSSTVTFIHDILISMNAMSELINELKTMLSPFPESLASFNSSFPETTSKSSYNIPKTKLMLRLSSSTTEDERGEIKNGIKNYLRDTDILLDTIDIAEQTNQSLQFMTILNTVIAALTSLISFFMLLISLVKNIKDNIWELGIMRSMGLDKKQIYLVYFVETLAVIFAALIIGTVVGMIVAATGVVYYVIFFELPFKFYFPYVEFFSLTIFLILTSVLTTYIGIGGVVHHSISKILKGNV